MLETMFTRRFLFGVRSFRDYALSRYLAQGVFADMIDSVV